MHPLPAGATKSINIDFGIAQNFGRRRSGESQKSFERWLVSRREQEITPSPEK